MSNEEMKIELETVEQPRWFFGSLISNFAKAHGPVVEAYDFFAEQDERIVTALKKRMELDNRIERCPFHNLAVEYKLDIDCILEVYEMKYGYMPEYGSNDPLEIEKARDLIVSLMEPMWERLRWFFVYRHTDPETIIKARNNFGALRSLYGYFTNEEEPFKPAKKSVKQWHAMKQYYRITGSAYDTMPDYKRLSQACEAYLKGFKYLDRYITEYDSAVYTELRQFVNLDLTCDGYKYNFNDPGAMDGIIPYYHNYLKNDRKEHPILHILAIDAAGPVPNDGKHYKCFNKKDTHD